MSLIGRKSKALKSFDFLLFQKFDLSLFQAIQMASIPDMFQIQTLSEGKKVDFFPRLNLWNRFL
jgi:hypothetical protein